MQQVKEVLQKGRVDPYLRMLILHAFDQLDGASYNILQIHPTFPIKDYNHLLTSQSAIGWLNFLKGYPSTQWSAHQQRYLQEMNLPKKSMDDTWLQHLYMHLYQQLYSRWKHRNEIVHNNSDRFTHEQLLHRIQGYYKWKTVLPPQDQHCFDRDLPQWQQMPIVELKKWLHTYETHIKICVQQARERTTQQVQDIRKWIKPTVSTSATIPTPSSIPSTPKKKRVV